MARELVQNFRRLKKGTKKLEDRLARLNQAEKKLPDLELGLRPAIENFGKIAGLAISALRQANETRLLSHLLNQSVSLAPTDTGNLLIPGDETVKCLRAANEQKLLQQLAKSGSPLSAPDLEEFSFLANTAQHDLVATYDIKFVSELAKVLSSLRVPELGSLTQEAIKVSHSLRLAADLRQLEQLKRIPISFETPEWQILKSEGKKACDSLRKVNDFLAMDMMNRYKEPLTLPNIARFATRVHFTTKRLQATHEARILTKIFKSETNRRKIIKKCYFHAEWAGSDLQKWERVFAEYEKSPVKLKIMDSLIDEAHSMFALILSETQKLEEIQKRCEADPFLQHEYEILNKKIEQYYEKRKEEKVEKGKEGIVLPDSEPEKIFCYRINDLPSL